jgi:phenylacetate-CoA ligase
MAGIGETDRIQITPGYGLWTAGIGFQNGCERLGAMAVPMGPGNTEKQLRMMQDMGSTVICSTSSYALLLAEEVRKRDLRGKIKLHTGIIGSEFWGIKTRETICENLGIDVYDIYGLTEIYGPGIGIDCRYHNGIHLWDDYIYCEIIDPVTGEVLPEGEKGELVITTFRKEGAPLVRYRTHDLTRMIPGRCPCGCDHTRIDRVSGRTDDMFKVKAVNMFPAQFEEIISSTDGTTGEFLIVISTISGKDSIELFVETEVPEVERDELVRSLTESVRSRIGITVDVAAVDVGSLPRSEKKTARVIDRRD